MATLQHYVADPDVRKRSWQDRLSSPAWQAKPNAGHLALVELERRGNLDTLVTQNVDGLHLMAGTSPERLIQIHGTMREVTCLACGERAPMERALARVRAGEEDPACRSCGGILKSATISFGQNLDPLVISQADEAARDADLVLAIGTTLTVYPAAGLVPTAAASGARIVILNAEPTAFDHIADVMLTGGISEILPALVATH